MIRTTTRSDREIRRYIIDILQANGAQLERDLLTVEVRDRVVTLGGVVRCWSDRAMVEAVAWSLPEVRAVHNHLEVALRC